MKPAKNPHSPLNRSLHFWAWHTGYSVPTLSRWVKDSGIRRSRRKADPGLSLRQVLAAIDHHYR